MRSTRDAPVPIPAYRVVDGHQGVRRARRSRLSPEACTRRCLLCRQVACASGVNLCTTGNASVGSPAQATRRRGQCADDRYKQGETAEPTVRSFNREATQAARALKRRRSNSIRPSLRANVLATASTARSTIGSTRMTVM